MEPLVFTPTYELFLVLEPVREGFDEILIALAPLDGDDGPDLIGVDVYYRDSTDVALLALRFDERTLTYAGLTWVLDLAAGAGLPALDPSRLGDGDRRSFYEGYLSAYEVHIEDRPRAGEALRELGRRLDLITGVTAPPVRRRARTATGPSGRLPPPPARPPRLPTAPSGEPAASRSLVEQAAAARARASRQDLSGPTVRDPAPPAAPRGKGKSRSRKTTVPATPVAKRAGPDAEAAAASRRAGSDSPPVLRRPGSDSPARRTESGASPLPVSAETATAIDVQFLRGGQWVPARLRSLSSRGAYVVTGAPPRVGDQVHIAIDFRDASAMVHGTVHHVTTPEDALSTGSSGFAVRFPPVDSPARRQLVDLLRAARSAGITIKPPPARTSVRFPVHWPIRVGTMQGGFRAEALDVSTGGMFVATGRAIDPGELIFRLPLDNGDEGVSGRARVARAVDEDMATARGLARGYGLCITALADGDEHRYESFLDRVRNRSDKRIVVGADPDRARDLVGCLTAAGYSVTSSSDAGVLVRLADLEPRAPDAAIIDASLVPQPTRVGLIERAFTAREVPCLATTDEAPDRARLSMDRLLAVGV